MIEIDKVEVWGLEGAMRGMRNPMNSWNRADTKKYVNYEEEWVSVGENDLDLGQRLYKGGQVHRKFLRMIHIQMDVLAPLYWWKEYDTYKVGTTTNSCSTMHKIHSKEFCFKDFSVDKLDERAVPIMERTIMALNMWRAEYLSAKAKKDEVLAKHYWWQLIQLLPSSYNQLRTIDFDYETAMNIIDWREHHKLDEWVMFVKMLRDLPYINEFRGEKA